MRFDNSILVKDNILSLTYGLSIFLIFFTTKAWLRIVDIDLINVFYLSVFANLCISLILYKFFRARDSAIFISFVSILFLATTYLSGYNEFGIYKLSSVLLMLFGISLMKITIPSSNFLETLKIIAIVLFFYGCLGIISKLLLDGNLFLRERILLNGPIVFAQYMSISAVIFIVGYKDIFRGVATVFFTLLTFSKGPILSLAIILWLAARKKIVFLLSIVLTLFVLYFFQIGGRYYDFIEAVVYLFINFDSSIFFNDRNIGSVGVRIVEYGSAIQLIADNFITGIGVGNWQLNSPRSLQYPHNSILEIFVEMGVVISTAMIILFFWFVLKFKDSLTLLLFLLFFLFSMFSGSIVDNRGIFFVVLLYFLHFEINPAP